MKRPHPLHAALRHLVNMAQGPMDARLKSLAGGPHAPAPPPDDESALHQAIAAEAGGQEAWAGGDGEAPPPRPTPGEMPGAPDEGEPKAESAAEGMPPMKKRRHGARLF
jgi:hypothetical protein